MVYVIYVSDSKDDNVLKCVKSAIDSAAGETERQQKIAPASFRTVKTTVSG